MLSTLSSTLIEGGEVERVRGKEEADRPLGESFCGKRRWREKGVVQKRRLTATISSRFLLPGGGDVASTVFILTARNEPQQRLWGLNSGKKRETFLVVREKKKGRGQSGLLLTFEPYKERPLKKEMDRP